MRYSSGQQRSRFSFRTRLTPVVAWIAGLSIGMYLVYAFAGHDAQQKLKEWLILQPISLLDGHVWKLLTTVFFAQSGWSFFFNLLMLWLFVPVIEQQLGTRRFLKLAVATTLIGNAVSVGVGLLLGGVNKLLPIAGLSPFVYATIAAYGTLFADMPVQFFGVVPIKGKVLAIATAIFVALSVLLNGEWVVGAGYFAAMLTAWLWTGGRITPNLWLLKWRRARLKRRYTVISGGAEKPPKKQWLN